MNFIVFFYDKWYNFVEGSDFLLNENIRKHRKSKQMSQDELAEKLEVTRQSISLWETGQTQPSLDNIVALAKLFDISTDALLSDDEHKDADNDNDSKVYNKSVSKKFVLAVTVSIVIVASIITTVFLFKNGVFSFSNPDKDDSESVFTTDTTVPSDNHTSNADNQPGSVTEPTDNGAADQTTVPDKEETALPSVNTNTGPAVQDTNVDNNTSLSTVPDKEEISLPSVNTNTNPAVQDTNVGNNTTQNTVPDKEETSLPSVNTNTNPAVQDTNVGNNTTQNTVPDKEEISLPDQSVSNQPVVEDTNKNDVEVNQTPVVAPENTEKDIFGYFKNFVIQNGTINGDYCYYSKSADNYGGYQSEDFSLFYWGDTDKIEFCLHSVLDDTFSVNFYLYVPKHHTGNYEYLSSFYYRDTGASLYEARGVISAYEFTKNYPLNCTQYIGSTDVQDDFMEMSRQGICDLIDCLKNFISVEKIKYSFSDLGFANF